MIRRKLVQRRKRLLRQLITTLTLFIFVVVSSTGCVSIRHTASTIDTSVEQPSVSLSMYLKKPGQDEEESHIFHGVATQLSYQNEDGNYVPMAKSKRGNWLVKNAVSGKYKFEIIDSTIMVDGKFSNLQGSRSKTFTLKPDERAQIKVILKKTPVGLIIVLVVVVVLVVIWYIIEARDSSHIPKIPVPPVPPVPGITAPLPKAIPLPLLLPGLVRPPHAPVPIFINGGFYAGPSSSMVVEQPDQGQSVQVQQPPPEAIHFIPEMSSAGVAGNTQISIYFSKEMDEASFRNPKFIQVLGSLSGPVQGTSTYFPMDRHVEFLADHQFAPGETVTVILMGRKIQDTTGRSMEVNYEWSFTIAD